ncbi:MAG TPA: McrC family protein [Geobacteraceae bacterium]|nr:McrC family protein [Geobacteraceae bacterium]
MRHVRIFEYDSLKRDISPAQLGRLKRFDDSFVRQEGNSRIFDWNTCKATSYVGVIMIPGLCLEILPKIDRQGSESLAQKNLLYMLSLTRKLPIEERDLAGLENKNLPLLESLITIFVQRLLDEFRKGLDHSYIHHEENLPILKGKLLFTEHIRHNTAHNERVFVGYDDFVADTPINRIFKAACRRLLAMTPTASTQKLLREALAVLDEIRDCVVGRHDFDTIHLTWNNERFRPLLAFCRLVIFGQSPAPEVGKDQTFSLLFPMEKLFEEFVAAFICRHRVALDLADAQIHVQGRRGSEYLLKRMDGQDKFLLKPDIIIEKPERIIIDTKWKHLKTIDEDKKNGISQSDIYQLYAYANRYHCSRNVLLFPKIAGVDPQYFWLNGGNRQAEEKCIHVEFINLHRNLRKHTHELKEELSGIINRTAHGIG